MTVCIYTGEGASSLSIQNTIEALSHCLPTHNIERVNPNNLLASLKLNPSMLVMPGGRDIPYHEALKGALNQAIKEYVEEGGTYMGICAGAYYGCQDVEFEKGYPLEVTGSRELAFFPGIGSGPAYGKGIFKYDDTTGFRRAKVKWQANPDQIYRTHFNGGCTFIGEDDNTTVLASYHDLDDMPAIIRCRVGKGWALLSGVHFENADKNSGYELLTLSIQESSL